MRVARHETCCALGRFLVRIDVEGLRDARALAAAGRLRACLVIGKMRLPARVRPYGAAYQPGPSPSCVLDIPEVVAGRCSATIWDEDNPSETATLLLSPARMKWESRVLYRTKPKLVARIREGEEDYHPGSYFLRFENYLEEEGGGALWHVRVEWPSSPTGEAVLPEISCLDEHGEQVQSEAITLEYQRNVRLAPFRELDRLLVSLRVEGRGSRFTVLAHDPGNRVPDGFCCMDEHYLPVMRVRYWDKVKDACGDDEAYRHWLAGRRPNQVDLAQQTQRSSMLEATFSIIVPCFQSNEAYLREMALSVIRQSYPKWELILLDASPELAAVSSVVEELQDERIRYVRLEGNGGIVANTNEGIRRASGSYVAFLDHDDLLEPDALYRYAEAVDVPEQKRPQLLYCDEDSFHADGDYGQPSFKSDLNVDLLYCHNYVTHFLAVERDLVERIGPSGEDVSGAQDYDLTLRALAAGARVHHVARPLYHWRIHAASSNNGNVGSKPYAVEAGRLALQRHLTQRGIAASVENAGDPFTYRVRYELPTPEPLVSVIIPTRDHARLLEACVRSLFETSEYQNIEVLLVENGSVEPETERLYARLLQDHPKRVRVVRWTGEFNYSKIVNYGAAQACGDYLLLLNNDTEVISPDFIPEMLGYLQRPEVGVVGAKLYFPDGLVQHAGVIVGAYDALAHANQLLPQNRPGYLARAVRPGNFSAVTGACQMVRRDVFDAIDGYDESFAVGFNDADFCLRAGRAGFLTTFTPYAELYHREFASRGREAVDEGKLLRWKREQAHFIERWPEFFLLGCDPYSNPNLKRDSAYYALDRQG